MFSGFVTAWRLATVPTSRSPVLLTATTDGVMRPPSLFVMTIGSPPSMTATTLFVVPRSIPITFGISCCLPSKVGFVVSTPRGGRSRLPGAAGCRAQQAAGRSRLRPYVAASPLPTTTIAGRITRSPSL